MEQAQELEAAAALYAEATQWPALTRLVQDTFAALSPDSYAIALGRGTTLGAFLLAIDLSSIEAWRTVATPAASQKPRHVQGRGAQGRAADYRQWRDVLAWRGHW